ncbi:TetR/AcrR family transcriptional regulator [Tsukamurella sp. PLM1]|uniref:TetR/AcrR family transcriptional regulator n=1 Tax=Tsukamurella sp. PLM1 TaxID=2929795 RepID=UPI002045DF85|nr:TetR family transcriptional regulator [Tsukamurella sp. PLM1]BDH55194.1 DNA-binding transcriptional regulator [Tsukamurella sp. PLM1]
MTEQIRRRDPERRRREIVDGAVAIVLEQGPDALTHRKVAARAGVPLGSTTQYFATLEDLRAAALRTILDETDAWLAELEERFVAEGASPSAYAAALHRYLSDPQLVRGDFALTCAAPSSPELLELSRAWTASLVGVLSKYTARAAAEAVAVYTDGAAMHAVIQGRAPELDSVERAVAALWGLR